MTRIVYLATDPLTAYRLMDGQLAFMREHGLDVIVLTSPGPLLQRVAQREGVRTVGVPMRRAISPLSDLLALWRIFRVLRELSPALVNAGTPKAGLLGVLAARLAGVPCVIYHLRGLRYEGARGMKRLLLFSSERVAGAWAHRVFCNSQSLRRKFVADRCGSADKTWVPANGTGNGVEVERFAPSEQLRESARAERARLGIPADAFVVGFVGRLVRDKGIEELSRAFYQLAEREPRLWLLLVGGPDGTDPIAAELARGLHEHPRVAITGFVDEPAVFYHAMNVFAFPSYREGFPNAPLEAAAAELPVAAFRATGTVDAVVDGETGTLLDIGDAEGLARALDTYLCDPELAQAHGRAGARRVRGCFTREIVWNALLAEYRRLTAAAAGRPTPEGTPDAAGYP